MAGIGARMSKARTGCALGLVQTAQFGQNVSEIVVEQGRGSAGVDPPAKSRCGAFQIALMIVRVSQCQREAGVLRPTGGSGRVG